MSPYLLPLSSLQPAAVPDRAPLCFAPTYCLVGNLDDRDTAGVGDPAGAFGATMPQADPPPRRHLRHGADRNTHSAS